VPAGYPQPPQSLFKDLFVAVQSARIFPDEKVFPDAIPDAAPDQILKSYFAAHPASPQMLERFVGSHFELPAMAVAVPGDASAAAGAASAMAAGAARTAPRPPVPVDILTHINALWDSLTRRTTSAPPYSSVVPLPFPYVVPGGRFREIYYWDSYFTMLGLAEGGRADLVAAMIRDFAYLIDTFGHVPNGARTYYLSRSQPPFFFEMVALLEPADPAGAYARYLPELKREYAFWMQGEHHVRRGTAHRRVVALPDGSILNRYWDDRDTPRDEAYAEDTALAQASGRPQRELYRDIRAAAESGWDFSSRWLADAHSLATIDTTKITPIDLNSLLFGLENAIRAGCERRAEAACVTEFAARAAARHAAIDRYLWDPAAGYYVDYRWADRSPSTQLSAATLYPLFVALATPSQAASVAAAVRRTLVTPGGLATTLLDTGQQWDAPNGWAPLQWIAVAGLRRYGSDALAALIACRWLASVNEVYAESGRLVEKYDVLRMGSGGRGGEYPTQDGFGWTNGVTAKLIALYPAEAGHAQEGDCAGE
jgi:alpha,alpha-trehalase